MTSSKESSAISIAIGTSEEFSFFFDCYKVEHLSSNSSTVTHFTSSEFLKSPDSIVDSIFTDGLFAEPTIYAISELNLKSLKRLLSLLDPQPVDTFRNRLLIHANVERREQREAMALRRPGLPTIDLALDTRHRLKEILERFDTPAETQSLLFDRPTALAVIAHLNRIIDDQSTEIARKFIADLVHIQDLDTSRYSEIYRYSYQYKRSSPREKQNIEARIRAAHSAGMRSRQNTVSEEQLLDFSPDFRLR